MVIIFLCTHARKDYAMVLNRDINLNQPMVEEYPDKALQEAFNKGMIDTRKRYRGMLFMY